MKIVKLAALASALPFCFAAAAQAAPATISGSPALAFAAVVAAHSPLLSPAEKKAVAAIFDVEVPPHPGVVARVSPGFVDVVGAVGGDHDEPPAQPIEFR